LAGRPGPVANAAALLVTAPERRRTAVIDVLTGTEGPGAGAARRLAAELLLSWGEPRRAWAVFEPTVRQPSDETTSALERFADLAAAGGTAAGWRVRGLALGRVAD